LQFILIFDTKWAYAHSKLRFCLETGTWKVSTNWKQKVRIISKTIKLDLFLGSGNITTLGQIEKDRGNPSEPSPAELDVVFLITFVG